MGFQATELYYSNKLELTDVNRGKFGEVLKAFEHYFKPEKSMVNAWYDPGNLYSSQCKDQVDFMKKLCALAAECKFEKPDKVVKFLFLIYNQHSMYKVFF